jgi:hypothetical protein
MKAMAFKPGSEPEARWLAREISASIAFVADGQRRLPRMGLERRNAARAGAILTSLARGISRARIRSEFKLSGKVLARLVIDHRDLLERTRAWRVQTASRLATKAATALEAKLDILLEDPAALAKATVKDLCLTFAITTDQQRAALAECPRVRETAKITIQDALDAIETAKSECFGKVKRADCASLSRGVSSIQEVGCVPVSTDAP